MNPLHLDHRTRFSHCDIVFNTNNLTVATKKVFIPLTSLIKFQRRSHILYSQIQYSGRYDIES